MNTIQQHASADTPELGSLQINLTSGLNSRPVADATIHISYTGVPDSILEELHTDSSGQTETIELNAPPLEYNLIQNSLFILNPPDLNLSASPVWKSSLL